MKKVRGEIFFRIGGLLAFGSAGWALGRWAVGGFQWQWVLPFILCGAIIGWVVTPYLTTRLIRWTYHQLSHIPIPTLISATIGLLCGLILSALLTIPFSKLPGLAGEIMPLFFTLLFCALGIWVMVMRGKEISHFLRLPFPSVKKAEMDMRARHGRVIVDTSAIIDGRIADITSTGFLRGPLVIPHFVLDELQHIADSSDSLRRSRGRRGLEVLSRLQKKSDVPIEIVDVDFEGTEEVDAKLIRLAKDSNCPIITTDFNLNKVAELQKVRALNINELANVLKPVLLPGEEIELQIIQEGKETGQGVGFLEDGTMVVVEGGRRYLNNRVNIVVSRILQTAAGRMVFAQLKNGDKQ